MASGNPGLSENQKDVDTYLTESRSEPILAAMFRGFTR